jgi:hypothetical protein
MDLELAVVRAENTQLRQQLQLLSLEHFNMGNQLTVLTRIVATLVHDWSPNEVFIAPEELRAAEDACMFRFTAEPVVVEGDNVYGIKVTLQPATPEDTEKLRELRAANAPKPKIEIATG